MLATVGALQLEGLRAVADGCLVELGTGLAGLGNVLGGGFHAQSGGVEAGSGGGGVVESVFDGLRRDRNGAVVLVLDTGGLFLALVQGARAGRS